MIKPSISTLGIISVAFTLGACSPKNEKTTETKTASTTTVTSTTTTSSAPAIKAASVTVATPTTSIPSASATVASSTTTNTASAATAQSANTTAASASGTPNLALKADLTQLFKTLNELDRNTAAKQAEMAKKMQNAKTPAEQQAFFKDVVAQLDTQKAALNNLKFNDSRVAATRDKMVESITNSRAGTAELIKKPNATPETNPEIAKSMQKAQKSAEEARSMLMKLTEEAGIRPQSAEKAPTATKK